MRRALLGTSVALAAAIALSGCITVQVNGPDGRPSPEPKKVECPVAPVEGPLELSESNTSYMLTGTCGEVAVSGQDITISASTIRNLEITGDRIAVVVQSYKTLAISGQENSVEAGDGGNATITGDRNTLALTNDLDVLTINGNENTINVEGFIAAVQNNGDRNTGVE